MKKNFLRVLIVVVIIFASVEIVYAYSGKVFGGKITNTKATEIEEKEGAGYQCDVDGTSITIKSIRGPETYIIPSNVSSKTRRKISNNKWITGKYSGTTTVTCKKQCGETECTDTVDLNTISFFGNS